MDRLELADGRRIEIALGDLTRIPADAIVNAANEALVGGGGVDGAIHRAGGRAVMADLEARYGRRRHCPTGSAVPSIAGDLPARWVVHAVGPVWSGGGAGEAALLASAYTAALRVADELGARTVTAPAISTGVYRYPMDRAARVTLRAIRDALASATSVERVSVVLRSPDAFDIFAEALAELAGGV